MDLRHHGGHSGSSAYLQGLVNMVQLGKVLSSVGTGLLIHQELDIGQVLKDTVVSSELFTLLNSLEHFLEVSETLLGHYRVVSLVGNGRSDKSDQRRNARPLCHSCTSKSCSNHVKTINCPLGKE